MQPEEYQLPKDGTPINSENLKKGAVYFSVHYADEDLLIPVMETLVFIGRNLKPGETGQVYFQDIWSFKRGVRHGESPDETTRFYTGPESDISHIFEYEQAVAELVQCVAGRRKKGGEWILRQPAQGFEQVEEPARLSLATKPRWFRFDDTRLQERLTEELRKAGVAFEVRPDGAVFCEGEGQRAFANIVTAVRNSCFPWYLSIWNDNSANALRFWEEMKKSGLPFQVEHHGDGITFLLPKGSEDLHFTVSGRVLDPDPEEDGARS